MLFPAVLVTMVKWLPAVKV